MKNRRRPLGLAALEQNPMHLEAPLAELETRKPELKADEGNSITRMPA